MGNIFFVTGLVINLLMSPIIEGRLSHQVQTTPQEDTQPDLENDRRNLFPTNAYVAATMLYKVAMSTHKIEILLKNAQNGNTEELNYEVNRCERYVSLYNKALKREPILSSVSDLPISLPLDICTDLNN